MVCRKLLCSLNRICFGFQMGLAAEFALCRFRYMTQNQFVFWANSGKQHNFAMLFWDTMHFPQSEICVNHNYKVFTDPPQKHLKQGGRTVQKCRPPAGGRDRQKPRESHCHLPPTLAQLKLSMTLVMAMGNLVGWLIGLLIGSLIGPLVRKYMCEYNETHMTNMTCFSHFGPSLNQIPQARLKSLITPPACPFWSEGMTWLEINELPKSSEF